MPLYDVNDFDLFLKEMGLNHQQLKDVQKRVIYVRLPMAEAVKVKVSASPIEGLGLMTRTRLDQGESVQAIIEGIWTEAGRFANHSSTPSATVKVTGNGLSFVVAKTLQAGEELTVNYRQVRSCLRFG